MAEVKPSEVVVRFTVDFAEVDEAARRLREAAERKNRPIRVGCWDRHVCSIPGPDAEGRLDLTAEDLAGMRKSIDLFLDRPNVESDLEEVVAWLQEPGSGVAALLHATGEYSLHAALLRQVPGTVSLAHRKLRFRDRVVYLVRRDGDGHEVMGARLDRVFGQRFTRAEQEVRRRVRRAETKPESPLDVIDNGWPPIGSDLKTWLRWLHAKSAGPLGEVEMPRAQYERLKAETGLPEAGLLPSSEPPKRVACPGGFSFVIVDPPAAPSDTAPPEGAGLEAWLGWFHANEARQASGPPRVELTEAQWERLRKVIEDGGRGFSYARPRNVTEAPDGLLGEFAGFELWTTGGCARCHPPSA